MSEREGRIIRRATHVRELVKKVSKGPWVRWKGSGGTAVMQGPAEENTPGVFRGGRDCQIADCGDTEAPSRRARANARFIAAARTLAPNLAKDALYLLERLVRLRASAAMVVEAWDANDNGWVDADTLDHLRALLRATWPVVPRRPGLYMAGGSSERKTICRMWIRKAQAAGLLVLEDWTVGEGFDEGEPAPTTLQRAARTDLAAVMRADVLWVLAPALPSEGAATELGIALALRALGRRNIIVVSGPQASRNIFAHLADEVYPTHDAAFDALLPRLLPT